MRYIILLVGICGCISLGHVNRVMVTHVIVKNKQDTVKIKMHDIIPTKKYQVIGYDYVYFKSNKFYVPYRDYLYDYRRKPRYSYYGDEKGYFGHIYKDSTNISVINKYADDTYKTVEFNESNQR